MFIRIDEEGLGKVKGFSYMNKKGYLEFVSIRPDRKVVDLRQERESDVYALDCIYVEDIPKLIKALQAAYNHVNK